MTTARRIPRKVRRAHRAAAFHAARTAKAATPADRFRATADALISAAAHTNTVKVARDLREQLADHVRQALKESGASGNSIALYEQQLSAQGSEVHRLGRAVMCLQGAIERLSGTERDRLYEHYIEHFQAEAHRINTTGGVR